jgi:hypothetical protein
LKRHEIAAKKRGDSPAITPWTSLMDNIPAFGLDYVVLLFALPFFILARQSVKLRVAGDSSAQWSLLVWFGLGYGLAECLGLSATGPTGPPVVALARAALTALSLVALLEFGRRHAPIAGRPLAGYCLYPPLAALAMFGALDGSEGLAAACRLALGIPGCLLSGLALWRAQPTGTDKHRLGLQTAGVSLWLAVPALLLSCPKTFLPLATEDWGQGFCASVQCYSQAAMAFCALGAWTSLAIHRVRLASDGNSAPAFPAGCVSLAIVLSVAIGYAAVDRSSSFDAGDSQNERTAAVLTDQSPHDGAQAEPHANRTWEMLVAERRHIGLNFLKKAAMVVMCLVGAGYCINIGWGALKPRKTDEPLGSMRGTPQGL